MAVDKEIKPALRQPNPAIDSDTKRGREIEASALSAGLFREPRTVERKEETDLRTHTSTSLEMRMAAWREAAWTRVSGLQRERESGLFKRVQVNRANACLSLTRIPCGMSGGCLVRERPEYKNPTSMASRLIGTGAGKRLLPPALHAPPFPLVIHRPCHLLPPVQLLHGLLTRWHRQICAG